MKYLRNVAFILFMIILAPAGANADKCYECHKDTSPMLVKYWEDSAHPAANVGCAACHGDDVEKAHARQAPVNATVCGKCHEKAFAQHQESKHAIGLKTGKGCTRNMSSDEAGDTQCNLCHRPDTTTPIVETECAMFLAQSPEMRRVGCSSCHKVETGCDTCHTKHGTDLSHARRAETCGICHMGPDHAQLEMWRSSQHGVLFAEKGEPLAPTCATCHMAEGTHNVSKGITVGHPPDSFESGRELMIAVCSHCHAPSFAGRALRDADAIHKQSLDILLEAKGIVEELNREGLLEPSAGERPPHPIFGNEFVIGPHMLYEDISRAETIFFRMMMFYYMSAYKGAYHQSPDYSHWYGNAPLKLALSELKSEAASLRKSSENAKRLDNLKGVDSGTETLDIGPEQSLRELKDRYLRGEISEDEYRERKRHILEDSGL